MKHIICLCTLLLLVASATAYDSSIVYVSSDVTLMARTSSAYTYGAEAILNVYNNGTASERMTSVLNIDPDLIPLGVIRKVKLVLHTTVNELTFFPRVDNVTIGVYRIKEPWFDCDTTAVQIGVSSPPSPTWYYRDTVNQGDSVGALPGNIWSDTAAFYPNSAWEMPEGIVSVDSSSDAEFVLDISPYTMKYYRNNPDSCFGWVLIAENTGNSGESWKRQFYSSETYEPEKRPYFIIYYAPSIVRARGMTISGEVDF